MWMYLIVIVAAILGIAAAIAGLGPIAIILIVVAVVLLVGRTLGGALGSGDASPSPSGAAMSSTGATGAADGDGPQDSEHVDKAHVKTGFAHQGQRNMVPGEEHL